MLMVIFGAGASMDSVNPDVSSIPYRTAPKFQPPLAKELFADREPFGKYVELYGDAATLIYELRLLGDSDGTTVEDALQRFQSEAEDFPRLYEQLAAVLFYLRSVVTLCTTEWSRLANHVTNYRRFVALIEQWRYLSGIPVSYVTFNYDTMLEAACLSEMHFSLRNMNDYIAQPEFMLFKVHGSVNWGKAIDRSNAVIGARQITNQTAERAMIKKAAQLQMSREYTLLGDSHEIWDPNREQFMFPALAVPLRQKREFEMPAEHEQALVQALRSVSRLLVIGWAAADQHLLDLIAANECRPKRTLIVAGSDELGAAPAARLASCGLNRNVHIARGGFSNLLSDEIGLLNELLASR